MNWSAIAAVLLALAVVLGAFGAHGLRSHMTADQLETYRTAFLYHFLHALGILVVSLMPRAGVVSQPGANGVCWLLTAGIVAFSGSLYALAVTGVTALGAITPIGGIAFIAAWVWLAWNLARQ